MSVRVMDGPGKAGGRVTKGTKVASTTALETT